MLASQEKMLARLGRTAAPRDQIKRSFLLHLEKLHEWLGKQGHFKVLHIRYNELLENPLAIAQQVNEFLGGKADAVKMANTVDPSLYRNRKAPSDRPSEPVGSNPA
jgi:hypothetical protein